MEVYRNFYYMYIKKKYELPAARVADIRKTVDQNYHQPKIVWRKRSVKVKFKVSSLSPYRFAAHRCCNV